MVLQYLRSKKKVTAIKLKAWSQASAFVFTYAKQQVFAHYAAHFITGLELKIMKQ